MADIPGDAIVTGGPGLCVYQASVTQQEGITYSLVKTEQGEQRLAVHAPAAEQLADFVGEPYSRGTGTLLLGPLSEKNTQELRKRLSWLRPSAQGLRTGAGLGDRLGLATPGHMRAVRAVGGQLSPFPAQQSIREMTRTRRSAQQVMDDALWGVFAEGWRNGFGADADHLKTPEDIDRCLAVGYTFYTFDPGEYVESAVEELDAGALQARFEQLPWEQLADSPRDLRTRYLTASVQCEEHVIAFDELSLTRAAVKYGRAMAHVARLYRHLEQVGADKEWEVEVSVDETETPTTHAEHVYIVSEMRRLGVNWVSLAPRYIGSFEKGVDYIGDLGDFEADISVHAAIARTLGPYKLSLHSGSDKFSVYEIAARQTRGVTHLKTAGTSYLEALRTIAVLDPELFRSIYAFARQHYERDRASYHVSGSLERAPESVAELASLLDQFDAREILHVTFGSVLTTEDSNGEALFYGRMMKVLRDSPEAYADNLQRHFERHLRPFVSWGDPSL